MVQFTTYSTCILGGQFDGECCASIINEYRHTQFIHDMEVMMWWIEAGIWTKIHPDYLIER